MCKFRTLRSDEIDIRIGTINEKGCSLLLYKDARCDMNILDETVGVENWQRRHEVINNNLFCNVGIKINSDWIWKQDVGTESYSDKEKGEASDSFKRACVNWGIGRELYTAPFIWISAINVNIFKNDNNKWLCRDKFRVTEIEYNESKKIVKLVIVNQNNTVVYTFDSCINKSIRDELDKKLKEAAAIVGKNTEELYSCLVKKMGGDINETNLQNAINMLDTLIANTTKVKE